MRKNLWAAGVVAVVAVFPAFAARAVGQQRGTDVVSGSEVYRTYCAVCHGTKGKGDGQLADLLRVRPPDLTLLAKRNGGRYPDDKVHRMIDGRNPVKGHGGADMPVWGDAFRNASDGYSDAKVKEKIDALVEYLKSIQEPAR
jgi:mono/diheme cytochrome c family protein